MELELRRHDWARLRSFSDTTLLPEAIRALAAATDKDTATAAYWRIDNVALQDGCLTESAVAVASSIVQTLTKLSAPALRDALELLVQISGGYVHEPGEHGLGPVTLEECVREVSLAFPFYVELLETSADPLVHSACICLITACGEQVDYLKARSIYILSHALQLPNMAPFQDLIRTSLRELE